MASRSKDGEIIARCGSGATAYIPARGSTGKGGGPRWTK